MGCASSKRVDAAAAVGVYHPAPTSFAVFDINSIEEPWLKPIQKDQNNTTHYEKPITNLPAPILEKLNAFESEDNPHSWEEVSKALEHLKPSLQSPVPAPPVQKKSPPAPGAATPPTEKKTPRKSFSFHTLEEVDAKVTPKPAKELRKTESMTTMRPELKKTEVVSHVGRNEPQNSEGFKSVVKENIFIVRDRLEREKEGKQAAYDKIISKRDPLIDYPEKCPPNGADAVVIYTTSLRGVRRTYEDCTRARSVLEGHRVVFDERDVSLHAEFLKELKELVGEEGVPVPRVFVKGRYVGGVDELVELNESGRLGRIFNWARVAKGVGRQACEGCGGARFVPCLECGGSCKVLVEGKKERCGNCNENGLVLCPLCL